MPSLSLDLAEIRKEIAAAPAIACRGRIVEVRGPVILAALSGAAIGDQVQIAAGASARRSGAKSAAAPSLPQALSAQVVGFSEEYSVLTAFGSTTGLKPGAEVQVVGGPLKLQISPATLGLVLDSLGGTVKRVAQPGSIGRIVERQTRLINALPPPPVKRLKITTPLETGIRAIDGFATIGKGQRLCIFAEPGVGKSSLLGSLARFSAAAVNVIALVGERGREITELIEDTLDGQTLSRTVIVASTSDEPPICRATAAQTALAVAEYFRDAGLDVLYLCDSLTRLLRAEREVGLAAGEIPVRRGYPPSVFAKLPALIERAGATASGSITALFTMLLSSDFDEDPMVEEVKGLTDGHLILSRSLAERGHYPAVDIVSSLSRAASRLLDEGTARAVKRLRVAAARLEKDRELIALGGALDAEQKAALAIEPDLRAVLCQDLAAKTSIAGTHEILVELAERL